MLGRKRLIYEPPKPISLRTGRESGPAEARMRVRYALWMDFLRALQGLFRKKQDDDDMPYSIVMLLRSPFAMSKEVLETAAFRAYGVPYDGSREMYFVMYRRNRRMRCWRHWSQNCWTFAVLVSTFPGRTISQSE
jgi:hypothetical protein